MVDAPASQRAATLVKTFAPALVLSAALAAYVLLVAEVGAGPGYKDGMVASYYGYEHAGNLTASGNHLIHVATPPPIRACRSARNF